MFCLATVASFHFNALWLEGPCPKQLRDCVSLPRVMVNFVFHSHALNFRLSRPQQYQETVQGFHQGAFDKPELGYYHPT